MLTGPTETSPPTANVEHGTGILEAKVDGRDVPARPYQAPYRSGIGLVIPEPCLALPLSFVYAGQISNKFLSRQQCIARR